MSGYVSKNVAKFAARSLKSLVTSCQDMNPHLLNLVIEHDELSLIRVFWIDHIPEASKLFVCQE